jgi:hypothetical protein
LKATITVSEIAKKDTDYCKFKDSLNNATWNVKVRQGGVSEKVVAAIKEGVRFSVDYHLYGDHKSRWIDKITKAEGEDTEVEKNAASGGRPSSPAHAAKADFRSREELIACSALECAARGVSPVQADPDIELVLRVAEDYYDWIVSKNKLNQIVEAAKDDPDMEVEEFGFDSGPDIPF